MIIVTVAKILEPGFQALGQPLFKIAEKGSCQGPDLPSETGLRPAAATLHFIPASPDRKLKAEDYSTSRKKSLLLI
jgi:hypothetical protein